MTGSTKLSFDSIKVNQLMQTEKRLLA